MIFYACSKEYSAELGGTAPTSTSPRKMGWQFRAAGRLYEGTSVTTVLTADSSGLVFYGPVTGDSMAELTLGTFFDTLQLRNNHYAVASSKTGFIYREWDSTGSITQQLSGLGETGIRVMVDTFDYQQHTWKGRFEGIATNQALSQLAITDGQFWISY